MTQALRSLSSKAGSELVITMAPQTIDMQSTSNEYFKTALNIKDILTVVNMQYYNSGSMLGCDGKVYSQGSVDFLTALACIQLEGGLAPSQVGLGVPASTSGAGSGYVSPTDREQRAGLPGQGHELRIVQAVQDLPGAARRDDLVDELGRQGGQRLVERGGSARPRPAVAGPDHRAQQRRRSPGGAAACCGRHPVPAGPAARTAGIWGTAVRARAGPKSSPIRPGRALELQGA